MNTNDTIIACSDISLGYGKEIVIEKANLKIRRDSFLPLIGPNGAGKTTLLRGILGLIKPFSGRISTPFAEKAPGYVPQQARLDPIYPLTVRQIIAMGRHSSRFPWQEMSQTDDNMIKNAASVVGLESVLDKMFRELSGGMKQKTLIARALAMDADVIILDEPTSEVDKPTEIDILDHLHDLHEEHHKTVVLVCHAIGYVPRYADSFCVVNHGSVEIISKEELEANGRHFL
ncbi:metal ABC transporter ATP-binding protein [Candidatus Hydrogenedentota bacterium]